ncbi:hypothetical protein STEG23_023981 [Scotinomys teguina]
MGAEEEVKVTLAGGAPWGFRLQGGAEQKKPLQVSKIRRRSQAGRAGLRERDQLLAINGVSCTNFSHASAMTLIDASGHQLVLTVRRVAEEGSVRSPSPGELQVLSPLSPLSPEPPGAPVAQALQPGSLRSPPDSEAYYGETDSDVDGPATQEKPRRTRRRGPTRPFLPGAPPDEVYLSDSPAEPAPAKTGSPSQGDSRVSSPSWEEGTALQPPPAEVLLLPHGPLRPGPHLIPMVGPVPHPVGEDLTTTYTQKAKQAKLQRAESLQEKSVKEAKTKCRTIASLLTAAPNPHSKGVLMFKKRRQRAKKYTLVSFGAAAGTGTEEEDGIPPTSESELDEEAFSDARSLTNQSDWDSPYLDMELARAGSGTTESQSSGMGGQLSEVSGRGVQLFEQQRQRAASSTQAQGAQQHAKWAGAVPPRAQSAPRGSCAPTQPFACPASPSPFFPDGGALAQLQVSSTGQRGLLPQVYKDKGQVTSISTMPLSGTPAPNKRRKSSKLIMELTGGGRESSGLNLGKKISVPRDVMLEELSLLTNRGSKMFKLRQMRVEKFIYENHPDVFSDSSMDHFQKFLPTVGGQLETAGQGFSYGKGSSGGQAGGSVSAGQYGSDHHHHQGSGFGAGGAGGPGAQAGSGAPGTAGTGEPGTGDQAGGEGKHVTVFKTYISPWDRAMGVDPQQKVELGIDLLAYGAKAELPKYKSFNRTAMPYGGYEKASKRMTFQMPKFDLGPLLSEPLVLYNQNLSNRPSFNRTPIPWLSSGEHVDYNVDIGIPLDGETEEL